MSYTKTQTFDSQPNTGAVFNTYRSDNTQYFQNVAAHEGGSNGVGTMKERSVSDVMLTYKPFETSVNTMVMLMGSQEQASNVVHEWFEDDEFLPDEAVTVTPDSDGTTYITNGSYSAETTPFVSVAEADATIFHANQIVRYATAAGGWKICMITAVASVVASQVILSLQSLDGENLPAAAAAGGALQYVSTSFPADGEPTVNPRGNTPSGYYTYLQKFKAEAKVTERDRNEELINPGFGGVTRAMNKTYGDMNYQLEKNTLFSERTKFTSGTNVYYTTEGIYTKAKATNYHTSDLTTGGNFDATKFKNALSEYIQFNFGAESAGSPVRQGFIDGRFASYLSRAYEDKIQIGGTDYVGGLRANRWIDNNGEIHFIKAPIFEKFHPVPNASLRNSGTPRAVCLLVDVPLQVVNVTMGGEELRDDMFKEANQNESDVYRVRATMGRYMRQKQYASVFEEVAE
jgi:hypothetical protein